MQCSASRIGCLLTPSWRARSVSTMCWPGGSSPPTIRSISASYTDCRSGTGRCSGRIIAAAIVTPCDIPHLRSHVAHGQFIGDCMQSAIPDPGFPRAISALEAVPGPVDGLGGGRRAEDHGQVVAGEVEVP